MPFGRERLAGLLDHRVLAGPFCRSRRRRICALAAAGLAALVSVLAGSASPASAHPLGNFTVNRFARVEVSASRVRIYYVLDEAEFPAFSERAAVKANPRAFTRRRLDEIAAHLHVTIDGRPLRLRVTAQSLDQPPGQAGLNTLRVAGTYTAALPASRPDQRHRLQFADRNEPDRVGWREIVIVARGDARILRSTAPQRDVSDELRRYPGDLIQAPLDLRAATADFTPGAQAVDALGVPSSAAAPTRAGGVFANLITRQHLNPLALAGILALAFFFGSSHALLPGHGKTVMAAYLVGTKGRPIDAVLLGVIVSIMHTFSVLVLGLALFELNHSVRVEQFYPQLTAASGVMAMGLGVWLLVARLRHMRRRDAARRELQHDHGHAHEHDGADHVDAGHEAAHERADAHEHRHEPVLAGASSLGSAGASSTTGEATPGAHASALLDHQHPVRPEGDLDDLGHHHHHGPGGHTHELPEDVAPLSRRGLVLLATSGGIVPSPSAVIVVVAAFSLGRIGLGLSLIAAFSIGLAATLTAVGLTLVFGRSLLERRFPNRSLRYLPLVGAAMLIVAGAVLAIQGLGSLT